MVYRYDQILKNKNTSKVALIGVALVFAMTLMMGMLSGVNAAKPNRATTIQGGEIVGSDGVAITTGFDDWGYNYQARLFNGMYCDAYRDAAWCQDYKDDKLSMKWNDAWLSNRDMNLDGELDRHYGFDSYIGSGAWLTNHQSGAYEDGTHWTYFVKIVAVPFDAIAVDGVWYSPDGVEIGPVIWGQFAIVQEVSNDPVAGQHGLQYLSNFGPGFGLYKPDYNLELVDSVDVDAANVTGVLSEVLDEGVSYKFKASSVANAGATIDFDAKYSITNGVAGDGWTDDVTNYTSHGPTLLDLFVDGASVDWGAFNMAHTYWYDYTGTGAQVNFLIYDIYYPNNTGSLSVDIFKVVN